MESYYSYAVEMTQIKELPGTKNITIPRAIALKPSPSMLYQS